MVAAVLISFLALMTCIPLAAAVSRGYTALPHSSITETEALMVQTAMSFIPCDVCEATVSDIKKVSDSGCATAIDNACRVAQKKFPQVSCSPLLEKLTCGVLQHLLDSQTPAQICAQVAQCQAPVPSAHALPLIVPHSLSPAAAGTNNGVVQCQCNKNGGNSWSATFSTCNCNACDDACHDMFGPDRVVIYCRILEYCQN
jgi:hypothetical protein